MRLDFFADLATTTVPSPWPARSTFRGRPVILIASFQRGYFGNERGRCTCWNREAFSVGRFFLADWVTFFPITPIYIGLVRRRSLEVKPQ